MRGCEGYVIFAQDGINGRPRHNYAFRTMKSLEHSVPLLDDIAIPASRKMAVAHSMSKW